MRQTAESPLQRRSNARDRPPDPLRWGGHPFNVAAESRDSVNFAAEDRDSVNFATESHDSVNVAAESRDSAGLSLRVT
jgi:alkanesulfonate monooxygenase SsuD/methylene tetrahydromethanopterin reductase-like flavin-dependent oxidoreductase (luciferase family)